MRKLIGPTIVALVVAIGAYWALSAVRSSPRREQVAATNTHFTAVMEPGTTAHELTLCNHSDQPLVLSGLARSCSCLRPLQDEILLPPGKPVNLPVQMVLAAPEEGNGGQTRRETYKLTGRLGSPGKEGPAGEKFSCEISAEIAPHPLTVKVEAPNIIFVPGRPSSQAKILVTSTTDIESVRHTVASDDSAHLEVQCAGRFPARSFAIAVAPKPGSPVGSRTIFLSLAATTKDGRELPELTCALELSVTGRATISPDRIIVPPCYVGDRVPISVGVAFCNGQGSVEKVVIGEREVPFEVSQQDADFATLQCQWEATKSGSLTLPVVVHCLFSDGVEGQAHGACLVLVRERAAAIHRLE